MKPILALLILSTQVALGAGASSSARSASLSPIEVGTPNKVVATFYTQAIRKSTALATFLNGGKEPKGDIAAPFERISKTNLWQYMKEHSEMVEGSTPYVEEMDRTDAVCTAYAWIEDAKELGPEAVRLALNLFYFTANVPLGKMEVKEIPGLNMKIPFMAPVMLMNQELVLSDEGKDWWNAAFAAEASILSAMQKASPEQFAIWAAHMLEKVAAPTKSSCVIS